MKIKISKLKIELELSQKLVEKEQLLENLEIEYLIKFRLENESKINICENLIMRISNLNNLIFDQKKHLLKLQFLLESRQLHLTKKLFQIYPIIRRYISNGDDYYTIRGLELNENSIYRGDYISETAIGYLSHLLQLISKYYEFPLRYQILYYASRSMIRDCIAIPAIVSFSKSPFINGVVLPLYHQGVEKDRFDHGIIWLKCNIQQIMTNHHIPYYEHETILANMYRYFT